MRSPIRLTALVVCAAAAAASPPVLSAQRAVPPSVHARLAATLDSIRAAIGATGMSAAVLMPDGAVWTGASGEAWAGTPTAPATLFDIGSVTKSYTAALVLRVIAEGMLSLDDSLTRWRPDVPGSHGVTIRDLLRQTSGIADYASHPDYRATMQTHIAAPWSPAENLRFVGESQFPPGTRWGYSNTNYVLLGLIAEHVTGRSYASLLRERVLDSLGLTSTFVAGADTLPPTRAHAFLDFTGDGVPDDLSALVSDPAFTRGAGAAGAIVATALDVARFARAYYSDAIVPAALRQAAGARIDRGDGWQYGFGLIAAPGGSGVLLGHFGNTAGQSAGVWHDSTANVTVAVLSNVHAVRMDAAVRRMLAAAMP
ncbi:MAG TPA: serine hydrolase domain-containing protein [Gemmatimonadaceae bacterium]|nr:serine hydrolase domain-containing protein [Gemmatimonadaceae bacterium]